MSNFDALVPYKLPPITPEQLMAVENAVSEDVKRARIAIAKVEGFLESAQHARNVMMNPIYLKEALESSEIENINTTLLEVLQQRINPTETSQTSSQLVVNYFFAFHWGLANLAGTGLSSRLVQGLHRKLLPLDNPEYRRLQVNIRDGRGTVRYTPPEAQHITRLMAGWEKLMNSDHKLDPLVLASAGHYQFEAIHPFTDGNGRTGRMLLTLHLVRSKLLSAPAIHISQYINADKPRYYQLLRAVTEEGELEKFVRYLIKGFIQQADHSYKLIKNLDSLRLDFKRSIRSAFPAIYSAELIDALFINPVQSPVNLAKDLDVHYVTASKYLKKLAAAGYLRAIKQGRHAFYINDKMLELLEDKGRLRSE